ncbi:kinesin-5 family plus-end directed microtubule motor, bimC subfamily Cut7 [Schizosaccharomyces osmophilus]|uniref:Kinesin-5 family plus-end directed microtubule motor, bimC subfamily Cut7 n=1 Tax=Schizosaccharomyces osmophilus TaxID=2545709 RepID=A0AAF0AXB6_9SCHI|nr:kinesin-5 family plus-end directed microtubule motor, bimC subfamily Cut7 [Schizosaccharomyces osmophilus]WBW74088.1 kinesin-5 family plus-end directed microtubule motor, bimC subfamily Cut7 [Schizosaccharomyces osmophilus]
MPPRPPGGGPTQNSGPNVHSKFGMNAPRVPNATIPRKRRAGTQSTVGYASASPSSSAESTLHDENETNINVAVRVRGRSDREIRDNSALALSTSGAVGAELAIQSDPSSMLVAKTYAFDKVFGPEADQLMLFEHAVSPILTQVLNGYNCTIFAYGQTGTGKTYTMSGDLSDSNGILSEGAGLIPRTLYNLFSTLDNTGQEYAVKCSYYELYNEEIRDLLVADDLRKRARVFEDSSRQGNVVVTGMEEFYIKNAAEGLRLLREGSYRRHVAATRCNDLSSRSHSIFTVTIHTKVASSSSHEPGFTNMSFSSNNSSDDYMRVSKLHLVDLAGSENIGRSGAENKRARETGMINQSLLTLGRVINALVEKSHHIPYRESKLTRLLQDSLGGKTKTSMIVTVSSTNSNIEETLSTLEYASRAKSIRNKPQNNQLIFRKVLIKDLVLDIERLKADLIATRQKNGVYLAESSYKELIEGAQSKSTLCQEQARKLEVLELNIKNAREQLQLVSKSNQEHRKEIDSLQGQLASSNSHLETTRLENENLREQLTSEIEKRKEYETSEQKITTVATDLSQYYRESKEYIVRLYEKLSRTEKTSEENEINFWNLKQELLGMLTSFQGNITDGTNGYFNLLNNFNASMEDIINNHSVLLNTSVQEVNTHFSNLENLLREARSSTNPSTTLDSLVSDLLESRKNLLLLLENSLQEISMSSQKLGNGISTELIELQKEVKDSYRKVVQDLRTLFNSQQNFCKSQKESITTAKDDITSLLQSCTTSISENNSNVDQFLDEYKAQEETKQKELMNRINSVVGQFLQEQNQLLYSNVGGFHSKLKKTESELVDSNEHFKLYFDKLNDDSDVFNNTLLENKGKLQSTISQSSGLLDAKGKSIHSNSRSVYDECMTLAEAQKENVYSEVRTLDRLLQSLQAHSDDHLQERHEKLLLRLNDLMKKTAAVRSYVAAPQDNLNELTSQIQEGTTSLAQHTNVLLGSETETMANFETTLGNAKFDTIEPTANTFRQKFPETPPWSRDLAFTDDLSNLFINKAELRERENSQPSDSPTKEMYSQPIQRISSNPSKSDTFKRTNNAINKRFSARGKH